MVDIEAERNYRFSVADKLYKLIQDEVQYMLCILGI
jgi:hypothetical protein